MSHSMARITQGSQSCCELISLRLYFDGNDGWGYLFQRLSLPRAVQVTMPAGTASEEMQIR
jgi:hypothetical protein